MTDASRSQGVAAADSRPVWPPLRGAQTNGEPARSMRFTDVLAESNAPELRGKDVNASPEQMFEANIQDTRVRRKSELRRDYREAVDRRSDTRAQERTGVKARRSSAMQHEQTAEVLAQMPVKDLVKGNSARVQKDAGSLGEPPKHTTLPEKSTRKVDDMQGLVEPQQRSDGRPASGDQENPIPISSKTVTHSRQIGTAPMPISSGSPQPARELARLLASPTAVSGERDTSSMQSAVAGRSDQAAKPGTKGAKNAEPPNYLRPSTTQSKSRQSYRVTEFERLIRLVRAQSGRHSSTRVLLDPPELGKVHVRVIVEGDRVEVGVETENDSARQLISERAAKLKAALEEHGFVIDRFDVTTNQSGLFEQRFLAGQETLWSRRDQNGSGHGRGLSARSRGHSDNVQAAAAVEVASAGWPNDMGLDIQV